MAINGLMSVSFVNIERNRFDAIRLAAAAIVIVSHSWPLFGHGEEPYKALTGHVTAGESAVLLFFVVSGFLIYRSAERSETWFEFVKARTRRLVPGATVCSLFCMFVLGQLYTTLTPAEYFGSKHTWLYIKNAVPFDVAYRLPGVFEHNYHPFAVNGSLWTLPIELWHYIICGLAAFLLPSRYVPPLLAAIAIAIATWISVSGRAKGILFWTAYLGYYFSIGASMYVWRKSIKLNLFVLFVLFLIFFASFQSIAFHAAQAIFVPYFVVCIAFMGTQGSEAPSFKSIPDISYGLYIYGFPVQQAVSQTYARSHSFYFCMALSLAVTAVLATMSYFFVERPFLRQRLHRGRIGDCCSHPENAS